MRNFEWKQVLPAVMILWGLFLSGAARAQDYDLLDSEPGGADPLTQANRLLEEDRPDEAMEFAKQAEAEMPGDIETWVTLGKVYLAQGAKINRETGFAGLFRRDLFGEAEENFRKALEMDPGHLDARNNLAFTLCVLKNLPAASDQIDYVLERDPVNVYAHYLRGEVALLRDSFEEADSAFRKVLEIDPDFLDARAGLIETLTVMEKRKEAGEEVKKLLEQAPDLPDIIALAVDVYEPAELLEDAVLLYESLLDLVPKRVDLRFQLGKTQFRLERLTEAEALFEEVLAAEPEHEGALYFQGILASRGRDWSRAAERFNNILTRGGDYFIAAVYQLHYIAQTRANEGELEAAAIELDRILRYDPANSAVLADLALTLSQAGKQEEADDAYEKLIATEPWNSSYVNDYALHLMGSGRIDSGLAMLKKSAEIDQNPDALENLGAYYYFITGEMERAEPFFQRVLENDPERAKSLVLLESIKFERSLGGD
ncbi:MAG: tetratricopeptide repeat protein [Planctomycetota bacterium]|jgi:tetratricopeptide (TPR) repeat protein